jgi:hypothetical protein
MQQALETLEEINKLSVGENAICLPAEIDGAMDALRERLAQPEQELERVANAYRSLVGRRPWVTLTNKEYLDILREHDGAGLLAFYTLIEAKLREKNA